MLKKDIFSNSTKIGLAFSGGGIKGLCHAGALKAIDEFGIQPTIISGVSSGSAVAALYADGHSPDEISDFFNEVKFMDMTKIQLKSGGLFKIDDFEQFLIQKLTAGTFEELSIPLRVVASDLDNGKSVVFSEGKLVEKIIASCSVPVLFLPKEIDGVHYVDGGVFKCFPASTIREDCDILIGINASPMVNKKYKMNLINVATRSYHFMFRSNTEYDKSLCDILIEPESMGSYDTFDVKKSREIFNIGYTATKLALKRIFEKEQILNGKKKTARSSTYKKKGAINIRNKNILTTFAKK